MEATFFDEDYIKTNKTILCPVCKTEHKISLNDCDVDCEMCGECLEPQMGDHHTDFIWHPSMLF